MVTTRLEQRLSWNSSKRQVTFIIEESCPNVVRTFREKTEPTMSKSLDDFYCEHLMPVFLSYAQWKYTIVS